MENWLRKWTNAAATVMIAVGGVGLTDATSSADADGHEVTYTVTTESNVFISVYFMVNQPLNTVDYSDGNPKFLHSARPEVNPDSPWTYTTKLANPNRWAWVGAGQFYSFGGIDIPPEVAAIKPKFRCEIAVDGNVVASNQGDREVTCGTPPQTSV